MFESEDKPRSPHFWQIIVIAVVLFVATMGLLVFFLHQGVQEKLPLPEFFTPGIPIMTGTESTWTWKVLRSK